VKQKEERDRKKLLDDFALFKKSLLKVYLQLKEGTFVQVKILNNIE